MEFEQACQDSLEGGRQQLLVDLAELQYVSSMGLRSFLRVAKAVQKKDGVLLLCGMKGLVKEVFDMTHITSLFRTFDSVSNALASLG